LSAARAERKPSDGHDTCRSRHVPLETTFVAVAEDGHTVGELFVDDTVAYDENTDAFVIRTGR